MAKNLLYKKLVRLFESTIKNHQEVNSEFYFAEFEKIISNQKKDNRYYRDIQQFLVDLRKFKDKNELIFIFPESRKKYQLLLEKVETLLTARPLEASRQTRSTNNCVVADPYCYQYHDNLDMTVYQNDLQKSSGFLRILNRKQSIDFRFSNTIFSLRGDCISRQGTDNNSQRMCRSDYAWFLKSMAIYLIGKKVRAEAQNQRLSQQNDAAFAQIIRDISSIGDYEQNDKQLNGIFSNGSTTLENINEFELEKFIFNAEYLPNEFKSAFPGGNSSNLLERVNHAVRLKITELKNLEPEESNVFTGLNRDHYSRPVPANQSVISGVLQKTGINTTPSTSLRSAEDFNWKIIAPVIVGGIGIIVFIVTIIIWYSKKNRSENSGLGTERIPLVNSISDNLHVQKIAIHLSKRLESLKHLERYDSEIGVHYISFCSAKPQEEAIEHLNKIKKALTKFLEPKKTSNKNKDKDKILSNKDKIISNKLKSALLIVDSLMQRYNLLSLPNINNSSKNDYITHQLKSALTNSINSMLNNIEFIRDNYKGLYKTEKNKLENFGFLFILEKAVYDTMLSAHAEGYFEKYPQEQIKTCLEVDPNDSQECELPKPNTNIKDIQECELQKIKNLQNEALSTLKIIKDSGKNLANHLSKSNETDLYGLADSIVTQSDSMTSQLLVYFTHYNTRWEILNKQTQASAGTGNPTFFGQPKSSQINQPAEIYNAGQILKP